MTARIDAQTVTRFLDNVNLGRIERIPSLPTTPDAAAQPLDWANPRNSLVNEVRQMTMSDD